MSWFKFLTSHLVVAQIILVPGLSHAARALPNVEVETISQEEFISRSNAPIKTNTTVLTEAGKQNVDAYKKYAEKMNYDTRLDLPSKKMYLIDRDTKKVAMEIPLADAKSLLEYSPKTLNQKMATEFMKVKMSGKAAWSHTLKSFPIESAMFAIALGGLVAVQLFTDYANNPIGMKQHIEHQLSPIGQIGFFMFMLSQGVTANALNMFFQRPSLGIPIAMLGMTVGYAVQTYFSQVAMDPHMRDCAASVFKGEKIENNDHPCEGVYKYLVLDKKILEGPAVISLLGVFLITAGATTAIKATTGMILRKLGIEVSMYFAPGGLVIKGARLLASAANIVAFTDLQVRLEHMVAYAWKNHFDGKAFVDMNDTFVSQIEALKKSQWSGSAKDLNGGLREFSKKMSEWRVNNLQEAYAANQAWSEFLGLLTSNYAASYNFYSNYMDQLNAENTMIDRAYPLNGVIPKDLAEDKDSLYVSRPDNVEHMQAETTLDVADWMAQNIQSGYYKSLGFSEAQQAAVLRIQAGLANEDVNLKGKAILELNDLINKSTGNVVGSMQFGRELYAIYNRLGQPSPMFEKGRGFAASTLLSKSAMAAYKDVTLPKTNGRFNTPNVTDYYVVQMICGPEIARNEKVVSIIKGFPAQFNPPALALDDGDKDNLCFGASTQAWPKERIYNLPFSKQRTAPDYIRANIDPEAKKGFVAWWENGTEAQLKEAFKGFKNSYKSVADKLYAGLNNTTMSSWNRGLISNGALIAMFQELRLYNLVLGELLKDSYKTANKKDIPQEYMNATLDPKALVPAADYEKTSKPLLSILGRASRYDFNVLVGKTQSANSRSLKIQKEVENEFAVMNQLIQKAQKGEVKTKDFQAQMKVIETKLSAFSSLLGINQDAAGAGLVTLDEDKKALAVTCLELLQTVSQEMVMYGNMATTGAYQNEK